MDKREVIRVLDEAKKVLIEKGWTQGHEAEAADGMRCGPWDGDAVAFCVVGAAWKACAEARTGVMSDVKSALMAALPPTSSPMDVFAYNDAWGRTKEDVLALIDKAKELVINGQV